MAQAVFTLRHPRNEAHLHVFEAVKQYSISVLNFPPEPSTLAFKLSNQDQAKMLFTAFGRYMMGQCILLARFSFLPE